MKLRIRVNRGIANVVKAAKLEILIIMKFRSKGPKHDDDLHLLAIEKYNQINWNDLEKFTNDKDEYSRIKTTMERLHKIPL
jgi:hypothetical protein